MKRIPMLLVLAGLLVAVRVLAGVAGFADDTSAIAGMPRSAASWVIGPLFVALHLLAVVVAPILAIAGCADAVLRFRERDSR